MGGLIWLMKLHRPAPCVEDCRPLPMCTSGIAATWPTGRGDSLGGLLWRVYGDSGKENGNYFLGFRVSNWWHDDMTIRYLGGQGDLVSRLVMGIDGLTIWVIGKNDLLTKSP